MRTKKVEIKILWHNPPSGYAILTKTFPDGRQYVREISPESLLTTLEASELLGCSLNYIHLMAERGIINFYKQGRKKYVKMKDLVYYKENKRGTGRPRKGEACLIN